MPPSFPICLTIYQTYKQAKEKPNIIFYVVDPGWVKTGESISTSNIAVILMSLRIEMGGEGAFLEPEFSVSHLVKLLTTIKLEQSGKFFKYDGTELPW